MNLTVCSKLCVECPFSKKAKKGWLGSHTLEGVIEVQKNEELFSCHLARKTGMTSDQIESGEIKICRGYVASATKSDITFGKNDVNGEELRRLQQQIIAEDKEDKNIILSQDEFKEHHGEPGILSILNISHEEYLRRQGYGSGLKVP